MFKFMVALWLAITTCDAVAVDVTATGTGSTMDSALQRAKKNALEQVTGEFIVAKSSTDGKQYTENTASYSGGVVKKYQITNAVPVGDLIEVTIDATIEPNKDNNIILTTANIPQAVRDELEASSESMVRSQQMFGRLNNAADAFAVVSGPIKYNTTGTTTNVTITVGVKLSPKWIDDVRVMSEQSGTPIDTNDSLATALWVGGTVLTPVSMMGASLIRSAARLADKQPKQYRYSNCFGPTNYRDVDKCYAVSDMLGDVVSRDRFIVVAKLMHGADVVSELTLPVLNNNQVFALYDVGTSLYFRGSARERKFNSRGVLWFSQGIATATYTNQIDTTLLATVDHVEFFMR